MFKTGKQTKDTEAVTGGEKLHTAFSRSPNTDYSENTSVYSDGYEGSKHSHIWTHR